MQEVSHEHVVKISPSKQRLMPYLSSAIILMYAVYKTGVLKDGQNGLSVKMLLTLRRYFYFKASYLMSHDLCNNRIAQRQLATHAV